MTRDRGVSARRNRKPSVQRSSDRRVRSPKRSKLQLTKNQFLSSVSRPWKAAIKTVRIITQKRFFSDWRGWVALSMIVTGGLTALSLAFLFKLPAVPNCPSIFWPLASASLRLQCAQLAASKRTAGDLLEAIQLVNTLPPDHPLHDEISRLIEIWSREILDLGEEAFQAGKLGDAIDIAKKVPKNVSARSQVDSKIKQWQTIWASAEAIYRRAEDALRKQNLQQASTEAARLLSIGNNFWQTTKYQELTEKVASTRQDIGKLSKANDLVESGGLKNLQEAIKLASSINNQSYVYQDAQKVLVKTGQAMLDLAQNYLDRKDLTTAIDVIRQIPPEANLQAQKEDFEQLATAASRTWNGAPEDYEAAIEQATKIGADRPFHDRAQRLIARWQAEKGDIAQLARARQLAQTGRFEDLQAAIASASQIPTSNPRSREARDFVNQLTDEVQTKEDRPLINQADEIANRGDKASLQQAIQVLGRISQGRSLFEEANRKRQQYRQQLQQILDQENPTPSPSPSPLDSPNPLREQDRIQAEQSLTAAREAATGGTIDALAEAIRRADGVSVSSPLRREAEGLMNGWGQQMLQAAIRQSNTDVSGAIATAQRIPPGTEAYAQAQLQIQAWRRSLGQ